MKAGYEMNTDCGTPPPRFGECQPYTGDDLPFIFVSYSRADSNKVRPILGALYRTGFTIWFDDGGRGIRTAEDWDHYIFKDRLPKSAAFLSFVSQHNEDRIIIQREMEHGIKRAKEEGDSYRAVFVCLEKVATSAFPEMIKDCLNDYQFISYKDNGGLTDKFMQTLISSGWPDGVVDENLFKATTGHSWCEVQHEHMSYETCVLSDADFAALAKFDRAPDTCVTDEGTVVHFFTSSPEHINQNTAYATFLDNQWVPEVLYEEEAFRVNGLVHPFIREYRTRQQRIEVFRGLISNWQLVINRAMVWNTPVFAEWFTGAAGETEREAFATLAYAGAFVVFLMLEKSPLDKAYFSTEAFEEWVTFCLTNPVTFLRLDWQSSETNRIECYEHLSHRFMDFCLSLADNPPRLEVIAEALGVPNDSRREFLEKWREVQEDVIAWNKMHELEVDRTMRAYSRERFYRRFLVQPSTEVKDGKLDWGKPFVAELKKTVDLLYQINLPNALQIQPLLPPDAPLLPSMVTGAALVQRQREIGAAELVFAITEFHPAIPHGSISVPDGDSFTLDAIVRIRELKAWKSYMLAVSEAKERSRIDQVNLYDAFRIWKRHRSLLEAINSDADLRSALYKENSGYPRDHALSLILRFETVRITVVYSASGVIVRTCGEEHISSLRRKTLLTMDVVCCDVFSQKLTWEENPLFAEIRHFEGLTHEDGCGVIKALMGRLDRVQSKSGGNVLSYR